MLAAPMQDTVIIILKFFLRLAALPFLFIGCFLVFGHLALNHQVSELQERGVIAEAIVINKKVEKLGDDIETQKRLNKHNKNFQPTQQLIEHRIEHEFLIESGKKMRGSYTVSSTEYSATKPGDHVKIIYLPSKPAISKNYGTLSEEKSGFGSLIMAAFFIMIGALMMFLPNRLISLLKYIKFQERKNPTAG